VSKIRPTGEEGLQAGLESLGPVEDPRSVHRLGSPRSSGGRIPGEQRSTA